MNYIEAEATARDFICVRITLDEGHVKTEYAFFFILFDSIFQKLCQLGYFGGLAGKAYDTYLDIISTFQVPPEKEFCPFIFPIRYAKIMGAGSQHLSDVPDMAVRSDLEGMARATKKPIAVLLDECNVLSKNRIILEKIRNIFMNLTGYMVVFSGTEDLFPIMDEIFSPIIRQFKKIYVRDFVDPGDTEECIRNPLLSAPGLDPDELFSFERSSVQEIHDLTGGRPYEIQLVCHFMFKRVQEGRASRLELNVGVLDEVRRELESTQNISKRPVVTAIRILSKRQLEVLGALCPCDGTATVSQIADIEYLVGNDEKWSRVKLEAGLKELTDRGVITTKDGKIEFSGDDFDKIYTKYYARSRDIPISIVNFPPEIYCCVRITAKLGRIEGLDSPSISIGVAKEEDEADLIRRLQVEEEKDVFIEASPRLIDLYMLVISHRTRKSIQLATVSVHLPWAQFQVSYYSEEPDGRNAISELERVFGDIQSRISEIGGEATLIVNDLPVISSESAIQKVERTENRDIRKQIARRHVSSMVRQYTKRHDAQEALFHAELALRFKEKLAVTELNNLGYLFMSVGRLTDAEKMFDRAIEKARSISEKLLATYNRGILKWKQDERERARADFEWLVDNGKNCPVGNRSAACLFKPVQVASGIDFKEVWEKLDVWRLAREALGLLEVTHGKDAIIH